MSEFATTGQLNGFGERLNNLEVAHMETRTISKRNEADIAEIKESFKETAQEFGKKANQIFFGVIIGSVIVMVGLVMQAVITGGVK